MKISKHSWHYRWIALVYRKETVYEMPITLCSYFWLLILSPAMIPVWALLLGVASLFIVFVALPGEGVKWAWRKLPKSKKPPRTEPGVLKLFWQFLVSVKRKMCPFMEYE